MLSPQEFLVTNDHLKLLDRIFFEPGDGYWESPMVDPKRPFGNSDIAEDIAELLGWEVDADDGLTDRQETEARMIHDGLVTVLQILCANVQTGISPGVYRNHGDKYSADWKVRA